jgi:4-diphosphocytidyl-2-C-methyl-D-erythritol kinase
VVGFAPLSKRTGSVRRLVLRTPAKVNLALEILGKRPDGYHEISTVLQAIDLFDRLTMEEAEDLSLVTTDPALPVDDANLVIRAARTLGAMAGVRRGARITLDKRIPVAAGLGGGSSDAAATLVALNRLWGLRWSAERLAELAMGLGMDVPFFLGRGRALATGRGERLEPLPGDGGYALVLANPNFPLSTRESYGRVPAGWQAEPKGTREVLAALRRRSATQLGTALTNHLEEVVAPAVPAIAQMKAALLAAGALGAAMSGSGPTVFGVARSLDHARQIHRRVNRAGWSCWAVRTLSGRAINPAGR